MIIETKTKIMKQNSLNTLNAKLIKPSLPPTHNLIFMIMKTKLTFLLLVCALFMGSTLDAQTIAVADFSTNGVHATPNIVAKLTRLELIKLNKYVVIDEADMSEILQGATEEYCYGKNCLIALGEKLKVPLILSGSVEGIGNKLVVTIKLIDVKEKSIKDSRSMEFINQEAELQRMIGIMLKEMHKMDVDPDFKKQLMYQNEIIIANSVGKMNNSGPRMGFAFLHESELYDFYKRKESQGGLGIFPAMTNIGYQFEGQYIGTENFSALAEFIVNIGGMEQGQFQPSFSILNGFRFGSQGWEFAFGPNFGFKRISSGYFDGGNYITGSEAHTANYTAYLENPANFDPETGATIVPYQTLPKSMFSDHLDKRGDLIISTNWIIGVGRTFKAGALNIPVNVYYSSNRYGGGIGASIGFNVNNNKTNINR